MMTGWIFFPIIYFQILLFRILELMSSSRFLSADSSGWFIVIEQEDKCAVINIHGKSLE